MRKELNVVCVTKHFFMSPTSRHLNITGEIIFDEEENVVIFSETTIKHRVIKTRAGLDSTSLVIVIRPACQALDTWELYTDTPAEGSNTTSEIIREKAKKAIRNSGS